MAERISTDDYVSIVNFMGNYCWLVDEGDADGWAALWTEDGAFVGGGLNLVGHEQLKSIPRSSEQSGQLRHAMANLHCRYGETRDIVHMRLYNHVTNWSQGGAPVVMAVCEAVILRDGDSWKVKRNDVRMLRP